jgi:hypothetical protein
VTAVFTSRILRLFPVILFTTMVGCGRGIAIDPGNSGMTADAAVSDQPEAGSAKAEVPPANKVMGTSLFNARPLRETISLGADAPRRFVWTSHGLVFSTKKGELKVVTPGASLPPTVVMPGLRYSGVHIDDRRRVYVSHESRILRLTTDLKAEDASWTVGETVRDIAVSRGGPIYWTGMTARRLFRTDTSSGETRSFEYLGGTDLNLTPDDRWLISISVYPVSTPISATGEVGSTESLSFTLGSIFQPDGVAVDDEGNLYFNVVDKGLRRLVVTSTAGHVIDSLDLFPSPGPAGLGADCTFGGADRLTLYCVGPAGSENSFIAVSVRVPGGPR